MTTEQTTQGKWTEARALRLIISKGAIVTGRSIRIDRDPNKRKGVMGNGTWGAVDFLVNHCDYRCNL